MAHQTKILSKDRIFLFCIIHFSLFNIHHSLSLTGFFNEANYGQSKADFISKLHIALKETAETEYWLRLLVKSELLTNEEGESLLKDCLEIKRVLISSINTAKKNNN